MVRYRGKWGNGDRETKVLGSSELFPRADGAPEFSARYVGRRDKIHQSNA